MDDHQLHALWQQSMKRYIPPSSTLWSNWGFTSASPTVRETHKEAFYRVAQELNCKGFLLKAGYSCTDIRGYHNHYLFYKEV